MNGIAGVDIATVLFDVTKNPEPAEPTDEWRPRSEPSSLNLLRQSAGDLAGTPLRLTDRFLSAVRNPQSIFDRVGDQAEGVSGGVPPMMNSEDMPSHDEMGH